MTVIPVVPPRIENAEVASRSGLRGWRRFVPLRSLVRQRWQILFLIRKEFFANHRGSVFALFWSLVLPIVPITAYIVLRAIVSGRPGEDGIHPMVYVTFGVTLWMLFKDMVLTPVQSVSKYSATIAHTELTIGGAILVGFGGIIVNTLLRFAICVPVVLILTDLQQNDLQAGLGYLLAGIAFFFACGLISVPLTALFPDLKNIYNLIFSYMIFFSLAIFPFSRDSIAYELISWNPFASFIDAVRLELLLGRTPEGSRITLFLWATPVLVLIATFLLRRTRHRLKEAFG